MRRYYEAHPEKFKRTPEQTARANAARRARYANDPEYRERAKASTRKIDPAIRRDQRMRRQFGIGADEFDATLAIQGGRRLAVDHCHDTGIVRGLLCGSCNLGIGKFTDDPERLERAAMYLRGSRNPPHSDQ